MSCRYSPILGITIVYMCIFCVARIALILIAGQNQSITTADALLILGIGSIFDICTAYYIFIPWFLILMLLPQRYINNSGYRGYSYGIATIYILCTYSIVLLEIWFFKYIPSFTHQNPALLFSISMEQFSNIQEEYLLPLILFTIALLSAITVFCVHIFFTTQKPPVGITERIFIPIAYAFCIVLSLVYHQEIHTFLLGYFTEYTYAFIAKNPIYEAFFMFDV